MSMGDRKLFYAKDNNQNIVHVDRIREKDGKYFCPFCKCEVLPKMGTKKTWHFAHKNNEHKCEFNEVVESQLIEEFKRNVNAVENIDVPQDCQNYMCPFCRNAGNKDYAVTWRSNIFICKSCFQDMNGQDLDKV